MFKPNNSALNSKYHKRRFIFTQRRFSSDLPVNLPTSARTNVGFFFLFVNTNFAADISTLNSNVINEGCDKGLLSIKKGGPLGKSS